MKTKSGISGSTLKFVAMAAMLVDHIGAGVLARYLVAGGGQFCGREIDLMQLADLYTFMRQIGRLAFPIFCFFLVEGFEHTRDVRKYAARLFAFCLISEIPFDLLFNAKVLEFGYQNVYFTLLAGLGVMQGCRMIEQRTNWMEPVKLICSVAVLLAGMGVAELLHTDYAANGVFMIYVLYLFRKNKYAQLVAGAVAFLWEEVASLAFIPLIFYNGKRGCNLKYFFYIFYPAHLLILYFICMGFGMAGVAVI